jgi:hypothetical protein
VDLDRKPVLLIQPGDSLNGRFFGDENKFKPETDIPLNRLLNCFMFPPSDDNMVMAFIPSLFGISCTDSNVSPTSHQVKLSDAN